MKVISQLISHFWGKGELNQHEIDYLLDHGFVRLQDVPGHVCLNIHSDEISNDRFESDSFDATNPQSEWTLVEETLSERRSRKASERITRSTELKIDDVIGRLNHEFERRGAAIVSLVRLAESLRPVASWQEAAAELHAADPSSFYELLHDALKSEPTLFESLWLACDIEPFHRLIPNEEMRGRAARAFYALLVSKDAAELGSYSWILKQEEAQSLINLRVVNERFLASVYKLFREDRQLLNRAIQSNRDVTQLWSLVLLYNALRDPSFGNMPKYGVEYGPLAEPSKDVWRTACNHSFQMDCVAVTKFLVAFDSYRDSNTSEQTGSKSTSLLCPVGWRIPEITIAAGDSNG